MPHFPEFCGKVLLGLLGLGLQGVHIALTGHPQLHLFLFTLTETIIL